MAKTLSLIIASVLVLSGCATSRTIVGQDGKPVHAIQCDGMAQDITACYEKAGELCGAAGYDLLGQDGTSTPVLFAGGSSLSMVSAVRRSVMVRCKP